MPGILSLLPAWVDWCLERSGLSGEPADRARAMARRMKNEREPLGGWDAWEAAPLRRAE